MVKKRIYKVLIVEDDPKYALPFEEALLAHGEFEVVGVTSSSIQAWELVKSAVPDAILVDLQLEEGDGIALLVQLEQEGKGLPFVPYTCVITRLNSDAVLDRALNLANYLFKKNEYYTTAFVVNHLEIMKSHFRTLAKAEIENAVKMVEDEKRNKEERRERQIRERIGRELDALDIPHGVRAREYAIEAIYLAMKIPRRANLVLDCIYEELAETFGVEKGTVERSIKRLLNSTFKANREAGRRGPTNKAFVSMVATQIRDHFY